MILPKNQIKQFAQMKEAFQNADNSSDNEKQKNVNEEPVGAEILRKIDAQRQMLQKRNWNDEAGFFRACIAADAETVHASGGIGTLSEKKMHSVIKYFIEPDASKHESRVGNSIVDVKNESGVFEVQTASFNVLRKKLPSLLISNCVTVVHPIPFEKHIVKLNAVTGEIGKRRKSPKKRDGPGTTIEHIVPVLSSISRSHMHPSRAPSHMLIISFSRSSQKVVFAIIRLRSTGMSKIFS